MPLVFVHGVANRQDDDEQRRAYRRNQEIRDALFLKYVLERAGSLPASRQIFNPFWGSAGAVANLSYLPQVGVEGLGGEDVVGEILAQNPLIVQGSGTQKLLVETARNGSREQAIDLLWSIATVEVPAQKLAGLASQAFTLSEYARKNPKPDWLAVVKDDEAFLRELFERTRFLETDSPAAGEVEALGTADVPNEFDEALSRIQEAALNLASQKLLDLARTSLQRMVTLFFGDVFVYLDDRGSKAQPGKIIQAISQQLDKALALRTANDPLIVVAHSLGGIITYDLLSYYRPEIEVDAVVTVGSQLGMFAVQKLFKLQEDQPELTLKKPENVKKVWLNVFDPTDALSFATKDIVAGVEDLSYSSGVSFFQAHGAYFVRPSFYDRLGERLVKIFAGQGGG